MGTVATTGSIHTIHHHGTTGPATGHTIKMRGEDFHHLITPPTLITIEVIIYSMFIT
jgi:hypothetical protein